MLSTQELGNIHDNFRSETAALAAFVAVTALAEYENREVMGGLAASRLSLMLSTSIISNPTTAVTAAKTVGAAVFDLKWT